MAVIPPLFADTILLLGGAVIAAPIFKRIGLGTVLGYLAAGVVIGPLSGLIADPEEILHFSELGVVMLLFIIGLELHPSRLWKMRYDIFGLGGLQIIVCGLLIAGLALAVTGNLAMALVAGFGLSLSSTAFVMQMVAQRGETNSVHGRKALAILLMQDIAIVPLLAAVPLLAFGAEAGPDARSLVAAVLAIAALYLAGRYLLNPAFRLIARTGASEVMIAAALLVVFGAAMAMQAVGLSMALGAFIAGVLLADSSFRHELEADVEPFRGLLLGLFFMAVGMSLDLSVLVTSWYLLLIATPLAMAIKAAVIYLGTRVSGAGHAVSIRTAALLTQFGEFGFVLFASAFSFGLLDRQTQSLLIAIVIVSMMLTPLSVAAGEWLLDRARKADDPDEDFAGAGATVLMIGFSRMGQVIAQALLASGTDVTIIDNDPERIRNAAKFGFRIYFGDGTRPEVLRAAGIEQAELVAVTTHKREITDKTIAVINSQWPGKRIYARAYDRAHTLDLMEARIEYHVRETFESALVMGEAMLRGLGHEPARASEIIDEVRRRDAERLVVQKAEGIMAGGHMLHTRAVKPEPLIEPRRKAEGLDDGSRQILEDEAKGEAQGGSKKNAGETNPT